MLFSELELGFPEDSFQTIYLDNGKTLDVKRYLSMKDKIDLLQFIVDSSIDEKTGCFSPVRTEVAFAIGLAKWYAGVEFAQEDIENILITYDILEFSGVNDAISGAIPEDEYGFMEGLIYETTRDIARYNNSAIGIINALNDDTTGLNNQITDILDKIKNSEGLEQLEVIKDVVGTN